jgi:ABC-type transport system involved in multi-copper enzyme maturation permease subunit
MKILAIAINTFKEAIRDKIFYSLVFFAVLLLGVSVVLSSLSMGEQQKIIADFSLAGINIFGVIIAVFVGIGLVSKEIEKKTVYTLISKPIRRWEFLLGKYCGLALTLLIYVSVMTLFFMLVLFLYSGGWQWNLLLAVFMIYIELLVVTAVALVFSTFSTPTLSAAYALAVYVLGHLTPDLKVIAGKAGNVMVAGLFNFIYYLLPNLENFNIKGKAVHGVEISAWYVFVSTSYGLVYTAALLLLASLIFQRRNFK